MEASSTPCYRARPYFRNVGVAGAVFSAALGLSSTFLAFFNVDGSFPNPAMAATMSGIFWSFFLLLGFWLILFYHRYRLYANHETIRQVGVISDRTVTLRLVDELKWRRFPTGGSVRIVEQGQVVKIELGTVRDSERNQLIDLLRSGVNENQQVGWSAFQKQFEETQKRREISKRAQTILLGILGFHAVAFLTMGIAGLGTQYLIVGLINVIFLGYFFRSRCRNSNKSAESVTVIAAKDSKRAC